MKKFEETKVQLRVTKQFDKGIEGVGKLLFNG